jgi:hypothetical protein
MQQLCIEYFYPLTEQMDLNLDYKPCNEFEEAKRKAWMSNSVISNSVLMSNGSIGSTTWANVAPTTLQFRPEPEPDMIGYWEIDKNIQVWRKTKPVWLHRKMTKVFFGWEWKDK